MSEACHDTLKDNLYGKQDEIKSIKLIRETTMLIVPGNTIGKKKRKDAADEPRRIFGQGWHNQ